MSYAGIEIFERNLRRVMDAEAFKRGDFKVRAELLYRLLRSKYGVRRFGGPKELPAPNCGERQ